jgi:steroid 5-alpha reductase family enzyme
VAVDWPLAFSALIPMALLATLVWILSVIRKDVGIIDSFWSLFFVTALWVWMGPSPEFTPRLLLVAGLIVTWALRLAFYLTYRNWGKPEDRRYQDIRRRNQPHYEIKSLFYVFYLQVFLAWCVALPLLPAVRSSASLGLLDVLGASLFLTGLLMETIADAQMARFKASCPSPGSVMDRGLWRYSRHPNYFGEALLWWGFLLIALAAGAPEWVVLSPLFMTFLLLKVSGIPLLEADLSKRGAAYQRYVRTTSPFWPRPPKEDA